MITGIHIFRKDLRVYDNLALIELSKVVDRVIGVFIFDSSQIKRNTENRQHYSKHAAQFIIESVADLKMQCDHKLVVMLGNPIAILKKLIERTGPKIVSFNADYSKYARKRDQAIINLCKDRGISTIVNEDDQTHTHMRTLLKRDGTPYMVFGTFFKNLQKQEINRAIYVRPNWYLPPGISRSLDVLQWKLCDTIWKGGRHHALAKLRVKRLNAGDTLGAQMSCLSAYLNQGCLSVREVYWNIHARPHSTDLVRSLAWRDFFLCIFRFHQHGNSYTRFIDERYGRIRWPRIDRYEWDAFIECRTGFLLVDASLRELKETGFTNNRSRLILATFWIKYLMISPLNPVYGSQVWFSRLLIDCSASQNRLNHLWVIGDLDLSGRRFAMKGASSLSGRSMRIDNEMIKRYDPKFEFIRKWLPDYRDLTVVECKQRVKDDTVLFDWKDRYGQYAGLFKRL